MNMEEYNDGNILETEIDDAAVEENDSIYFSISSFGADYTVDGLIKRLEKKANCCASVSTSICMGC